ncbi:MAG: cysteine--tRNA ligase [Clostridiaceae bacterium]|nr:cysteine--tRNA ligase [Eubacteriales bacterium]
MKLYNTMTRRKEEFVPLKPGEVSMYVCGPTVYNFFHIGNARPFVVFDTLRRYFESQGNKVTFVQNFTDVDDKIIRRANEEHVPFSDVGARFIEEYYRDADALSIERATVNPRATEHIKEIVALVARLVDAGHAYATPEGDVYFAVRSYPAYGKLSGQSVESLESGARIDPGEQKRDPLDFALWKAAKPGEPAWESPWGMGRPGWHIECSAMSMAVLGETFDIHCGGQDLVFPHHENEVAQSEAATGKPFARYWLHNGFINIDNQKMSKSLNNFLLVRDISKEFDLDAVRFFLLSAQYRNPVNFSRELVEQASAALTRLKTTRERIARSPVSETETEADAAFLAAVEQYARSFNEAMDDDLNTADAIGVLFDFCRAANTFVSEPRSRSAIDAAARFFDRAAHIFGILQKTAEAEFPAEALALLEERAKARTERNFARADELREKLRTLGYAIEDAKDGAKLKKL